MNNLCALWEAWGFKSPSPHQLSPFGPSWSASTPARNSNRNSTQTKEEPAAESTQREWVNVGGHVKQLDAESWETYWKEMRSSEALEFIRDAKSVLYKANLIGKDFRIETKIVNADVVAGPIASWTPLVFPEEKLALATIYRHHH